MAAANRWLLFALTATGVAACGGSEDADESPAVCAADGSGSVVGTRSAPASWTNHKDETVSLAGYCGRPIMLVETTIWSTPDALAAPRFKAWQSFYDQSRLAVIMVVGEDDYSNASEPYDAKIYKQDLDYPDTIEVLADPKWKELERIVTHSERKVPYFVLLDGERNIRYVGDGGAAPDYPAATKALEEVTGVAYQALATCVGLCGGRNETGCWCDETCVKFGDCCEDNCETCGNCP